MDFEEGEVDDISDTESDVVSPASERQIPEGKHRDSPVVTKQRKEKYVPRKRRHSRIRGAVLGDGPHNLPNGCSNNERPAAAHNQCNSDEEDFQIVGRERDRTIADIRRKKKRKKDKLTRPMQTTKCRFYMDGRCQKGDNCPYEHNFQPPKKQELCKFYAVGVCTKGRSCLFLHSEFPCKFFHLHGKCKQGDDCKFSHNQLNKNSRILLDRVINPKDKVDSFGDRGRETGRSLLGPGACSGLNEHGDVDYRCGQTHNRNSVNYGRQSPPQLFAPVFNQRPFAPDPCPEVSEIGNHPGFRALHHRPPRLQFLPDNPFSLGSPGPFTGQQLIPARLESPPFRHLSPGQRLRPELSLKPRPQLGLLPPRPSIFGEFQNPPGFPRFRPSQFRPSVRNLPPTQNNGFDNGYPTSEEIVRSELDKMAALLASSKPPSTIVSIDPRTQSPEQHTNRPHIPAPSEDTPIIPSTPKETQGRSSVSISSPEGCSSEPQQLQPLHKLPAVTWRLIQLDMNVKIPYPLMQLNVEGLPHRYEDPRLRGHLTAFRMTANQVSAVASLPEATETTEEKMEAETKVNLANVATITNDAFGSCQISPTQNSPVQRRPVKLQLNEMANTFLVSQQPTRFQSRHGDRSYLDDPRFRRRRILTSGVVGLPLAAEDDDQHHSDTSTSHSQFGASVVEVQGEMQHNST